MDLGLFRSIRIWNLLTYISGLTSLLAVLFAVQGNASAAGLCIGLSSLMDVLDGKFASLFQRNGLEKKMGVQIDSLFDGVAFGFAPVICLMYLGAAQTWSLAAGLFYLIAALTRLSFYNVMSQKKEERDFTGVPTTVIGVLWTLLLLFPRSFTWAGAFFLLFGVLMISPIKIRRPATKGLLVVIFPLAVFMLLHLIRLIQGV